MTDEAVVETQIRLKAVDTESMKDASVLSMEIEGPAEIVMALAELVLGVMQASLGAEIAFAGPDGEPIPLGPTIIDPLSTGDESVPE